VGETVCSMQRSPLEAAVRRPVGQKHAAKVDSVSAFRLPPSAGPRNRPGRARRWEDGLRQRRDARAPAV